MICNRHLYVPSMTEMLTIFFGAAIESRVGESWFKISGRISLDSEVIVCLEWWYLYHKGHAL